MSRNSPLFGSVCVCRWPAVYSVSYGHTCRCLQANQVFIPLWRDSSSALPDVDTI